MKTTLGRASLATCAICFLAARALPQAGPADTLTIPGGTNLQVELTTTVSTKTNQTGDLFTGKVTEPVFHAGEEVVPDDSTVEGHVSSTRPPGRATGKAEIRLVLDIIQTPDGKRYSIAAALQNADVPAGEQVKGNEGTVQGPGKNAKGGAIETGVAAAAGAGVGAIADGGTGALYGAAIGAAVAIVHTLVKHHGNAVLPAGTAMTFVIPRTVTAARATEPGVMVAPNTH